MIDVMSLASQQFDYAVQARRYVHTHPELSGKEENTVRFICEKLDAEGIPYVNVPNGGVIATIQGKEGGKTVMLRGDIDALPIEETDNNLKGPRVCKSENPGVMHACGHDAHTAMLLTAGKILNQLKEQFTGTVLLNFERGEEGGGNYAYLIDYYKKSGLKFDSCFGMHVEQKMDSGTFGINPGPANAGAMRINLLIKGRGGHGSRPDLSHNPRDCMLNVLNQIQGIRMNTISPFEQLTVTICKIVGGTAANIIPDEVEVFGTARYFSEEKVRKPFMAQLQRICDTAGAAYDCEIINRGATGGAMPLINDEACALLARDTAAKVLPAGSLCDMQVTMGSESFGNYFEIGPGCYGNLGVRNPQVGSGAEIHNCYFDIDEEAMKTGISMHVGYALNFLKAL